MARGRPLPGGKGSVDPDFEPQVGVSQPAFQTPVEETQLERLNRVLLGAGSAAAGALRSVAESKAQLDNLKRQAVARQEAIMAEAAAGQEAARASVQQQRITDTRRRMTELISRAEQHDPIWLVRQARLGLVNAPSEEERGEWAGFFMEAQERADKVALTEEQARKRQVINQFTVAGQTAQNAIRALGQRLKLDPLLQGQLIGDGTGIHDRVQDWALGEAARVAPELFDIDPDDPDKELREEQRDAVVTQLISATMPVADDLINQHRVDMEQHSADTGADLLLSQLTGYFREDIDVDTLVEVVNDTGTHHFNHLNRVDRERKMKQVIATGIDAALKGRFGHDVASLEERLRSLIDRGPFTEFEKADAQGAINEGLAQLAVNNFTGFVAKAQMEHTVEVMMPTDDGSMTLRSVPSPNAPMIMSDPGASGLSEYDQLATKAIFESGLGDDPESLTPVQLASVARILDSARQMNAIGRSERGKAADENLNLSRLIGGDPSADANKAYQVGFARRAFTQERQFTPNQIAVLMEQEQRNRAADPTMQGLPSPNEVWDGVSPIQRTPETRALRASTWQIEAEIWNDSKVRSAHPMPEDLRTEMKTMWTQGNPEAMLDVVYFAESLNEQRRLELLSAMGPGSAAETALSMALHNQLLAANNLEFKDTPEDAMANARQRMALTDPSEFLDAPTAFADVEGTNREIGFASFAQALGVMQSPTKSAILDALPFVDPSYSAKNLRENQSQVYRAFLNPSKKNVDHIIDWWSMRVQRQAGRKGGMQNVDPVEEAHYIWSQMRGQGFKFMNIDGEVGIVGPDTRDHFGPDDPRQETFRNRLDGWLDQPYAIWQREVLSQALGVDPENVPVTPRDIYRSTPDLVDPALVADERGVSVPIEFQIFDGTNRDSLFTLRKTPEDWGGVIVSGVAIDGRVLPVPRAKNRVEYVGPDQRTHTIVPGTPLLVFSQHLVQTDADKFVDARLGLQGRASRRLLDKAVNDLTADFTNEFAPAFQEMLEE
jgi:hypothetical protein